MNGRKSVVVAAGMLLGVSLLGFIAQAFATAQPAHAEAGQAFSISPPLIELKADPGQTVTTKIKLTNVSSEELLIKVQFNDFGAKDETGAPSIIFDDTKSTAYSLRNWIGSPAPFKVKSKETKTIEFPVQVPKDAEPGGHYATIRFTGTSTALEDSGVALNASIGTLVLMQVSGDIKEDASVVDFFTSSNFFESAPIGFTERLKNNGNIHVKPTGTVEVKNMFGETVANLPVNGNPKDQKDQPKSILPQSIRRFEQTLSGQWLFGSYTATLKLKYGDSGKELTATKTFWVIPYKLIILVLVGLAALVFGLRFALRRYKQKILSDAGHKPLKRSKR